MSKKNKKLVPKRDRASTDMAANAEQKKENDGKREAESKYPRPEDVLHASLKSFYSSSKLSDFTIKIKGGELKGYVVAKIMESQAPLRDMVTFLVESCVKAPEIFECI